MRSGGRFPHVGSTNIGCDGDGNVDWDEDNGIVVVMLVAVLLAAAISVVEVVRLTLEPEAPDVVIELVVITAAVTWVVEDVDVVPVADDVIDSEEIRKLVSSTVVAVEVVPVDELVLNTVAAIEFVKLLLHVAVDDIVSRSTFCDVTRFANFFLNRRMLRCKKSCRRDVWIACELVNDCRFSNYSKGSHFKN